MTVDVSSLGIVFPGQGAQTVGMGRWLVESFPVAADLFEQANALLGYNLLELCLQGPAEKLNTTEHSQPALFVVSMAAAAVLREKVPKSLARSNPLLG